MKRVRYETCCKECWLKENGLHRNGGISHGTVPGKNEDNEQYICRNCTLRQAERILVIALCEPIRKRNEYLINEMTKIQRKQISERRHKG